jgi:hypothetical protein
LKVSQDRIKEDTAKDENPKEKMIRWLVIAAVSLVVFGGLFIGGECFNNGRLYSAGADSPHDEFHFLTIALVGIVGCQKLVQFLVAIAV